MISESLIRAARVELAGLRAERASLWQLRDEACDAGNDHRALKLSRHLARIGEQIDAIERIIKLCPERTSP